MHKGTLLTAEGTVPLHVERHEGSLLVECFVARAFLRHVDCHLDADLPPNAYVRGLIDPGRGAWFDLHDGFGMVSEQVVELDVPGARALMHAITG